MAGFTIPILGINIDLILTLLIITLILVFCFFILLWEIFNLKKLIIYERTELKRFENDLDKIEGKSPSKSKPVGKSPTSKASPTKNPELVKYVKSSLAKGMNQDQIRGVLQRRGWKPKDIDSVFKQV